MSKEDIRAFLEEMAERHDEDIADVELPEGTREYVLERIAQGDADTIMFMLKLGYLMGLQTGYAVADADEDEVQSVPRGPIQA